MTSLRKRMIEELQLRNYSAATADSYIKAVCRFTKHYGKSPDLLGPEDVRQYLLHLHGKKRATNTLQVNRAALRFLYVRVLKRAWFDEIPAPKRHPLPITVLTPEQITRILDQTHNLKHWTILATFYASGLRCDELRKLKVADIDGPRMVLHIRFGKGGIPRDIPLSPALRERLRVYYRWRRPTDWLFPSKQRPHEPMENKTLRTICATAGRRVAIPFRVHPICFATPAPRICWTPAPTCAPSRFSSATRISVPRPVTCTSPRSVCTPHPVPSTRSHWRPSITR